MKTINVLLILHFVFITADLYAQADFSYVQLNPTSCKPGTYLFSAVNTRFVVHWDFGDGTENTYFGGGVARHTYMRPGSYVVQLSTYELGSGQYDIKTKQVDYVSNNYAYALYDVSSALSGDSCDRVDSVTFVSRGFGSGTITHHWQLSTGQTSDSTKISYVLLPQVPVVVQYIVSSNTGCSDTLTREHAAFPNRAVNLLPTVGNKKLIANFECTDSYGWTNYYYDPGTPYQTADDTLLLSIKKNGNDIGQIGNGIFSVESSTTDKAGSNTGIFLTNPLITNSSGFWVMNRYWKVLPVRQPVTPVNVRFYFNTQDLNDVNGSYPSHNLKYTDLLFYKTTGGNPDPSSNLQGAERIISIVNSLASDTNHWVYEPFGNNRHAAEFQVASFSGGGGGATGDGLLLPLQLTSFKASAQERTVAITWSTQQEWNIDRYEVLFSIDGENFKLLTIADPKVNPGGTNDYSYSYKESMLEKAYYKIRIIEKSGSISYSAIALVQFGKSQQKFRIYPNPASKYVTVENLASESLSSLVRVYNSIGVKLSQQSISGRQVRLDLSKLSAGNYKLVIINNNEIEYRGLIIIK